MTWWMRILNISSPFELLWVTIGFLGQAFFTGRMVVQWIVSEREKKSVVPPMFWWMSLAGGTMLVAYFLWRRDPVGVLGQSFGWLVYVRNLWLLYHEHEPVSVAADPAPEPELAEGNSSTLK